MDKFILNRVQWYIWVQKMKLVIEEYHDQFEFDPVNNWLKHLAKNRYLNFRDINKNGNKWWTTNWWIDIDTKRFFAIPIPYNYYYSSGRSSSNGFTQDSTDPYTLIRPINYYPFSVPQ